MAEIVAVFYGEANGRVIGTSSFLNFMHPQGPV